MSFTKKLLGAVAVGVGVALAVTGCSSPANDSEGSDTTQEKVDVTFGYIADFNGTSLLAIA